MEKAQTHYSTCPFPHGPYTTVMGVVLVHLFSFLELLPSIFCAHAPNIGKKEAWQSTKCVRRILRNIYCFTSLTCVNIRPWLWLGSFG